MTQTVRHSHTNHRNALPVPPETAIKNQPHSSHGHIHVPQLSLSLSTTCLWTSSANLTSDISRQCPYSRHMNSWNSGHEVCYHRWPVCGQCSGIIHGTFAHCHSHFTWANLSTETAPISWRRNFNSVSQNFTKSVVSYHAASSLRRERFAYSNYVSCNIPCPCLHCPLRTRHAHGRIKADLSSIIHQFDQLY
jgi:hypothetical protein